MPGKVKSRDEILADFENELLELHGMTISIDGHEDPLVYSRDMDQMPQRLHFILPEYSTYHLTIHYKPRERDLKNFRYSQVVKKHGIPFNTRKHLLAEKAPSGKVHSVTLPPEELPGGALVRGIYPAKSSFKEGDKTIFRCEWTIELVGQKEPPKMGGYA